MGSSRRTAQIGLGAACLILVSSLAVLVMGASGASSPQPAVPGVSVPADGHGYSAMAVDYAKPSDSLPKH